MSGKKYTDENKREAAAWFASEGSYAAVQKISGDRYNRRTIKDWHDNCGVFNKALSACQRIADNELSGKFKKFVMKGMDTAIRSIEYQAEVPAEEIKLKDVIMAVGIIHDKQRVMEGKATSHTVSSADTEERLKQMEVMLAERAERAEQDRIAIEETPNIVESASRFAKKA
jgi:hypothetical protein|tara:strand:+ start:415 stop:927 length:513 start_codon:yes stop_codon:yes gene_type:complete